jgi:hypothetical protein
MSLTSRRFILDRKNPRVDSVLDGAIAAMRAAVEREPTEVVIATYEPKRSLEANAAFHAMLGEIASATGEDAEDLKWAIKDSLAEYRERVIEGVTVRVYNSSAKWGKRKMAEALLRVEQMAAERGVTLTDRGTWRDAS